MYTQNSARILRFLSSSANRVASPFLAHESCCLLRISRCYVRSGLNLNTSRQAYFNNCAKSKSLQENSARSHSVRPITSAVTLLGNPPESGEPAIDVHHVDRIPLDEASFLVALVTPRWASLLESGGERLDIGGILGRILRGKQGLCVNVLLAVVDEIPLPGEGVLKAASVTQHDVCFEGSEGISLYVTSSKRDSSDLWAKARAQNGQSDSLASDGTIGFCCGVESHSEKDYASYNVSLSLPNTTFLNGRPFTIEAQRWKILSPGLNSAESDSTRFALLESKSLSRQTISLNGANCQGFGHELQSTHIEALTPFRYVKDSMGNILRTLKGSDAKEASIPASQELEKSIRQNVVTKDSQPAYYEIWAQVAPQEICTELPRDAELRPEDYLQLGHRFHRVLSGGGGWGKKQGLISLDPEPVFSGSEESSKDQDMPMDGQPFFQDLVSAGDVLRFVCVRRDTPPDTDPLQYVKDTMVCPSVTYKFGTATPSPYQGGGGGGGDGVEYSPAASEQGCEDGSSRKKKDDLHVVIGHFGALSHKPMSFSMDLHHHHHHHNSETTKKDLAIQEPPQTRNIVQTKLPPLLRFNYITTTATNFPSTK